MSWTSKTTFLLRQRAKLVACTQRLESCEISDVPFYQVPNALDSNLHSEQEYERYSDNKAKKNSIAFEYAGDLRYVCTAGEKGIIRSYTPLQTPRQHKTEKQSHVHTYSLAGAVSKCIYEQIHCILTTPIAVHHDNQNGVVMHSLYQQGNAVTAV